MSITITLDLPADVERQLKSARTDLHALAKEAVFVELFRRDAISPRELRDALGLTPEQLETLLCRHGVTEDRGTVEEYLADIETLDRVLGRASR